MYSTYLLYLWWLCVGYPVIVTEHPVPWILLSFLGWVLHLSPIHWAWNLLLIGGSLCACGPQIGGAVVLWHLIYALLHWLQNFLHKNGDFVTPFHEALWSRLSKWMRKLQLLLEFDDDCDWWLIIDGDDYWWWQWFTMVMVVIDYWFLMAMIIDNVACGLHLSCFKSHSTFYFITHN